MTKATLTLPLTELRAAVESVLPAVSSSEITPVLTGALLELNASGTLTLIGTDRYRVHRVRAQYEGSKAGAFLLPIDLLKWVVKNARFFGRRTYAAAARLDFDFEVDDVDPGSAIQTPKGRVTVTLTADTDTPNASSIAYTLPLINGNFPPVYRLIDDSLASEPTTTSGLANFEFVAEAQKLATFRGEPGSFRVVPDSPARPRGSGRLLITYPRGEALIQLSLPKEGVR